jgi:O-antigen/teichoic acid export membrane protein
MIGIINRTVRSKLFFNSSIATIDQAMLSALNFIISIILIKTVSKDEFGYYSIAFAIVQLLLSMHNSIVNTPLAVLLVEKKDEIRQIYPASLCYGQFIFILPLACLGIIVAGLLSSWGFATKITSIVAAISFLIIGLSFREFLRAYYYAEETPLRVLKLDVFYILLFMSLIVFSHLYYKISIAAVFIMNGFSALLISLFFVRDRGWRFNRQHIKESYRENWKFGKWALLGVIVTHMQNYSYIYLLGALLSAAEVAEVSAARLLMTPLLLAKIGWGKIVIPHGSRLRDDNQITRFFKEQTIACLIFVLGIFAYVIVLISLSGILNRFLFTESYVNSFEYVPYWGGFMVFGFFALSASYGLQVMKKFSILFVLNVFTMLVTVICAYFFIQSFGIKGGFAALILGGALAAIAFWYLFAKNTLQGNEKRKNELLKKTPLRKPNLGI